MSTLPVGIAVFLELDERAGPGLWRGRVDEHVRGIDRHGPQVPPLVAGSPFANAHHDGRDRHRESQGLVKCPRGRLRFLGGDPLAVDRAEPVRVEQPLRGGVAHVEPVRAVAQRVGRAARRSGPTGWLHHRLVQREELLIRVAGVEIVQPHRPDGRLCLRREDASRKNDEQRAHEASRPTSACPRRPARLPRRLPTPDSRLP